MTEVSETLELFPAATVAAHTSKDDCWITTQQRKVYDVAQFLRDHPEVNGAPLLEVAGKDATELLKELPAFDALVRDSSYLVGYLATELEAEELLSNKNHTVEVDIVAEKKNEGLDAKFDSTTFVADLPAEENFAVATNYKKDFEKHHFLDLEKPLLVQILFGNFTKDFYVDQVNRPRHFGKTSAPLFGNFLEPLSLTPWWLIPVVWLPVVIYHFAVAWKNQNHFLTVFLFGVGVFVWTFIEYALHRFVFHFDDWLPQNNVAFVIHFLLHGCHHYLPMDPNRLVMPPTLFVILCTPFYWVVFRYLPLYWAYAGFAGGLFGYVYYDECHYWLHHSKMPKFMRKLKKFHLEHHYKNYQLAFGITSWFWDNVFGTYLYNDSPVSPMKYN